MHSTLRKSFKKLKKVQISNHPNVFDRSLVSSDIKVNVAMSSSFFSGHGREGYDIDL